MQQKTKLRITKTTYIPQTQDKTKQLLRFLNQIIRQTIVEDTVTADYRDERKNLH